MFALRLSNLPASPALALVRRELLRGARLIRVFFAVGLVLAGCAFIVIAAWPANMATISSVARTSREILGFLGFGLCFGVSFFVPALASVAIVGEKEQQTFDQLFVTLITPRKILLGKMANAIGFFFLLIVAVAPVTGAVFFIVGVDWTQLFQMLAVCLAVTVSCAAISLLCSAYFRRSATAIIASYVGVGLCMGGAAGLVMMVCFLLAEIDVATAKDIARALERSAEWWCPLVTLGESLSAGLVTEELICSLLFQLAIGVGCLAMAWVFLRRPPAPPKVDTRKPIDDPAVLEARRKRFPYYLIDPLKRKKAIEDGRNPMFVKELRWGWARRTAVLIRLFYGLFLPFAAIGLFVIFMSLGDVDDDVLLVWFPFQMAVAAIFTPPFVANALAKEHEMNNLDALRMTLMPPGRIVRGKVLAGATLLAPLVGALLLADLPFGIATLIYSPRCLPRFYAGVAWVLMVALVSLSLSFFASLLTRRTSSSLVVSYILGAVMYLALPVGGLIFAEEYVRQFRVNALTRGVEAIALFPSPFFVWCFGLEGWPHRNMPFPVIGYMAFHYFSLCAFSVALLALTALGFRYFRMRDR